MPYRIEVQRENGLFISHFGPDTLRGEEFEQYLQDVVDLNIMFDREGRTQIYHVLALYSAQLDFEGMMRALTTIRQNKAMAELRTRLNSLSIMVTTSPVMAQYIETMLSNSKAGGRRMGVFPTVEAALAFIRFEQSLPPDEPHPTTPPSSPSEDKSPDP
jgi:hypothetical protein